MAEELGALAIGVIGGAAGGAAGALLGYFSAKLANSANRKGVRLDARLELIDPCIEDIIKDSVDYWQNSGNDIAAETKIKGHFETLASRIDNLKGFGVTGKKIAEAQTLGDELYELVTGGDFESPTRVASAEIPQQIRNKCAAISHLFHPKS
ncbi:MULTISPECIES: hypothetical protein [Stenotrophomonas]|uniref:Uncharacterized protein n=1 Tax=Stenotrophomonas maltophilia TaxID=40324 RepID=A0A3S0JMD8_STEMA|nr:hypothetical protein [Stenotrophomonas maltophilia]RTQ86257.1 hypothetical protein EKL94_18590 [Stenotrophomonas maltophilia]